MKRIAFGVAVVGLSVGSGAVASADQCAVVTKKQAELAKTYLGAGATSYGLFCEPCGDQKPKVGVVQSVSITKSGKGYAVDVNGSSVDLNMIALVDGQG